MAMTFPFRGPIPDWLNPDTAGHPYWKPPELPVKFAGRALLDGASAVYAFALEHQRRDLVAADEELRVLTVPPDPDHKKTLEYIEWVYREDQEVNPRQTPEYKAWGKWKSALTIIRTTNIFGALQDGTLSAFGSSDGPGSPPDWIHPVVWSVLEPDPRIAGKFSGDGLVFWNVRLVRTVEVIARSEAQEGQPKRDQGPEKRPGLPSLATLTAWYQARVDAWVPGTSPPSFTKDLRDAKAEFGQENRTRLRKLRHDLALVEWNVKTPGRKKNAQ